MASAVMGGVLTASSCHGRLAALVWWRVGVAVAGPGPPPRLLLPGPNQTQRRPWTPKPAKSSFTAIVV